MKASKPNLQEIYEDDGYCLLGADTVDCSSECIVRKTHLRVLPNQMILECEATGGICAGDQALKKMKDLLKKTFRRNLSSLERHGNRVESPSSIACSCR
jgi:hypothetical protein